MLSSNGRGLIATTTKQDGGRVRLTRAHELGHLVLHTSIRPGIEKVRETEANLFAGAFLIPEGDAHSMFSEHLTLEGYARIKAQYAVSIAALIVRAHRLGIVSAKRYRSLFIQLSSRGWRTEEPVEIPVERANSFSALPKRKETAATEESSVISVNFRRP
ncbi:ImmA/IrrE family metallo-endopeptidase [Corynebacterium diphtheriae]